MSSVLTVNPMQTTNARGTFYTKSDGLIQGVALDDPAARYALASGTLANSETRPLWGGVAVNELVPGVSSAPRGTTIKRATSIAELVGISVFNQAHNGLTTPQSPVPLFLSNMSVSFYRFGSGMRVPVKASDAVIAQAVTPRACRLIIHWCGISRPTVLMCSAPRLPTLKPQQLTGQRLPGIPPGLPRRRRQARITRLWGLRHYYRGGAGSL